jgi:ABC-type multidrug transport system ATPase subunit
MFFEYLKKNKKSTYFISSHNIYESKQKTNWVILIDKGLVLYCGTWEKLKKFTHQFPWLDL